jgi:Na+(H+)/acetate symporter ActP
MKKNMGTVDRVIRFVLAIVVVILYMAGSITGVAAIILGILAVVFIITSLIGFCPLYVPFKISTISKSK